MASLVFPADLASDQQKHFMKIKIFPSPYGSQVKKGAAPTIFLFMPGSDENGNLQWDMAHEYDEVKITKLGAGMIGGIGNMFAPNVTRAAETVAGYAGAGVRLAGRGTINPKVDLLYGNTQLRSFIFQFFMAPQSEKETKTVDQIVRTLRLYSSPEISSGAEFVSGGLTSAIGEFLGGNTPFNSASGQESQLKSGLWFTPPAEFMVSFHTVQPGAQSTAQISERENPYLPKIGRCVLSRVDVNYTQQGSFSTFKDGAPTNLYLTLVFNEMRVISQADVENGY